MTNHNRLNIGRLSWLVILLTIGILAVGSITKTSADSPVVVGLTDFSGQIGIAPEAILFDPVIAPFSVHQVEPAETSDDQTNIQLVIYPTDPGGSLPETTSLPTDAHPDQMIVVLPTTFTPQSSGEVDVTSHPAPDPEPVAAPEISIETVEIFQPGPPSQDLGEEGSIPVQVVEFNFGTVDQVLPSEQDPPDVVVVELEPVDELQGDVPQIDPSRGLQPEPEQPTVDDPTDFGGDTPTEPFSTEPGFVPSAATSDGPTGDANPATAPHTESLNLGNCECQDLTAWLGHLGDPKNMVYPAVTVVPNGQRQLVTVKIPYEWDLDCGSSARDYVGKCEETLSFSVKSSWKYTTSTGDRRNADPMDESLNGNPKGKVKTVKVTCVGNIECRDNSGKGTFVYEFRLDATAKLTGKVSVTITSDCGKARTAVIDVDTGFADTGNVNRPYSDWDGDGWRNGIDKFDNDAGQAKLPDSRSPTNPSGGAPATPTAPGSPTVAISFDDFGSGAPGAGNVGLQDAQEKAVAKLAGSLMAQGYFVTTFKNGVVIARKFYPENRIGEPLAEEKKFQVDKDGKIVTETHRTIVRDEDGVQTGEKVEKTEHSRWGKTVTTDNRKTDAGETTGGTRWVVTKRPGKKDRVKKFEWTNDDGWVEQPTPEGGWRPEQPPGGLVKTEIVEMELGGGKQNRPAPPSSGDDAP